MTAKKIIGLALALTAAGFVLYHSVYVENLAERRQKAMLKNFDPQQLVSYFWENEKDSILSKSVDFALFNDLLNANYALLAEQHGRKASVGDNTCFLVCGTAKVEQVSDKSISFACGSTRYTIPCRLIFSNTARDALGYFKIEDFENSMDYNTVSTELNRRVVEEVIGSKCASLQAGATIEFVGAVDVNSDRLPLQEAEIIPLKLEIVSP
jgi:predicted lipoprotein